MSETGPKLSPVPPKQSLLQVSPPEMVFQNVTPHEVSEMAVSFTNKDKIPRMVKVCMESSPYFQLACPSDAYHIVPTYATARVRIRFTPDETKDYSHELVCITAKERIVVPIRAIAARAVLDVPDHLDFSKCPVKYSTQKTLLVRNTGKLEAHYQLSTQSPFSVVPTTGTLGAGDSMQVTVRFHALTTGDHYGSLVVCYNTGEDSIQTNLHGEAVDLNVGLSRNSVEIEKTSITMTNHTTMFIKNRSNITAHFQWKTFPTEEHDNKEKRRQCRLLHPPNEVWEEKFKEMIQMQKVTQFFEDRSVLLSNVVQEEMAKVQQDPLLFSNDVFSIEPMEGEIRPNSMAEIKVTFKPLEAREYQSVAYCNISGHESRLPLHLRGEGQGPLVEFSPPSLNIGNILVNTRHVYEVKLVNQGPLDAPFTYVPSTTNMGFCFKFAPEEGIIAPGVIQTVWISFSATVLGAFEEKFQFSVAGSPVPAILTIKGSVIRPALHFDLNELSFGDISFGFPYTQSCRLTNTSSVPVMFKLRMSDDGTQPSVNVYDQIRSDNDPPWREGISFCMEPREFTMNPSQGTILPQGHQDIEVTLCSNTVMEFCRRMLVDLEGVGEGMASLVITARYQPFPGLPQPLPCTGCLVPELQASHQIPPYCEYELKVPYQRKFLVANNTDLPGCYGLIPQERKEDSPVFYSSPKPCGIVQPHSTAEIPLTIEVQTLGKHCTNVLIGVFGDERNPLVSARGDVCLCATAPGRVQGYRDSPGENRHRLLRRRTGGIGGTNSSRLRGDFRMEIIHRPDCFVVEPKEGVIPARGELPVTVTATLDHTECFDDNIHLFIGNSFWAVCRLQALGTGTAIAIDKPFAPELNLGYQFSFVPCVRQFKLTNRGPYIHGLFWSMECYSPPKAEGKSVSALSSPKDDSQSPKRAASTFGLETSSMKLQPGESVDMVLRGFSNITQGPWWVVGAEPMHGIFWVSCHHPLVTCDSCMQEVQDYVLCKALIGEKGTEEKIIETIITCEFIHPSVEASARQLSFRVEKKPSDVLTRQYQPLSLKNTCLLPLDLMLDVEQPFLVCDEDQQPLPDGQPVTVDVGETCHLYIAFDPAYKLGFNSWKTNKVLKIGMVRGHPFVEHITLQGEVLFPNLQIQPSTLEFGCIVAGTEEVRSLEITSCSPFPVKYHWTFHSDSQVNKLRDELYLPKFKPEPPKMKRTYSAELASKWRDFKIKRKEAARALKEVQDFEQSVGAEVPPQPFENPHLPLELEGFGCSVDVPYTRLKVEEAFSILPLSGVLQPGESQQVSFTFFGHLNTISDVMALCHVEGGPTYEVVVTGEASHLTYSLSLQEINCGSQMFNEIHHSTVTLWNTSKIEFNWVLKPSAAAQRLPGVFLVNPTTGSIAPGKKQVLKFSYMPGLPGAFIRTYQLKVGHLDPENIFLKGEASFPMISVNLPWNIKENEKYEKTLKRLITHQQIFNQWNKSVVRKKTRRPKTKTLKSQTLKTQTTESQTLKTRNPKTQDLKPHIPRSGTVSNSQMQIKMMRMLIEKPFLELQKALPSHPPKSRFPDEELCQSLGKAELFEYVLDMGPVLKGHTERSTLEITNPGQIYVSFQVDVSVLQNTGFSVDLGLMRSLPPSHTVVLEVRFESAHQSPGDMDAVLPIEVPQLLGQPAGWAQQQMSPAPSTEFSFLLQVTNGPTYYIRLHATVSEQSLELSKNRLHFSDTLIGQCQVETIRLYNWFRAPCKWFITATKPVRKRSYKNELKLNICGSSKHLKLHLSGQGLEPRLKFSPRALKMGWMLVDSDGVEATVVVKNPCNFPIEFYSLDFDEQYLEEEKILRVAVGSEYQNNFFMPPRAVGETLPPEVLEDYEARRMLNAQQANLKARAEAEAEAMGKAAPAHHGTLTFCPESMVKGTGNPVSRAVMRHLSIDASSERQPRGIVVIIHGPPRAGTSAAAQGCRERAGRRNVSWWAMVLKAKSSAEQEVEMILLALEFRALSPSILLSLSGKTEIAAGLCQYYDAAYISIDTVVKEAMANDGSPAGLSARELCTNAAMEPKGNDEDNGGKKPQLKNKQASGEKNNKKDAKDKTPSAQKKEPASKPNIKDTKFTVSTAPAPQQLNITSSGGEELNCLSCVLPEDLLVDILSERLECKDCYKGVVFDGLETLFASSLESSLLCVLRAVKNRCHIFMVNLHQDYASWQARDEAKRKRKEDEREKEVLQREKAIQRYIERILQMDEDEFNALPEEKKAELDKMLVEKKCIQRVRELKWLAQKLEEEAKALEEELRQKEEERRKEEERQKKEKKGVSVGKQPPQPDKGQTKPPEKMGTKAPEGKETKLSNKKETEPSEMEESKIPEMKETKSPERKETKSPEEEEIKAPEKKETKILEMKRDKIPEKLKYKAPEKGEPKAPEKGETEIPEDPSQMENLILRFQIYESSQQNVAEVLSCWDRVQGTMQLPVIQKENKSQSSAGNKGQKTNKPQEKLEKPEQRSGDQRSRQSSQQEMQSEVAEGAVRDEHIGVPCLDIQDKAPDVKGSSAEGQPKVGEAASRDSSAKEKQISTQRTESPQDSSATRSKSTLESSSVPTEFLRLKRYRWVVPAHGEVELKVHFSAKKPGKFEQTLRFELVQTKRQYKLPCCGTGLYPSISQDPRVVFPQWRETMEEDEIVFKEYVESTKQFHFGPLLCGKSRDWYKAQNCPSNSENITILNNSPMNIEVQFSFENDGEAATFLLDPPSMALKPKEKQELTIWAYPTSPGFLQDKLICSIGKNPEPVVFSLCCHGVHVKLEVSPLELSFDKQLLHRTDSRTLVLRNNTLLPMAWQLSGLDDLAEDFSLSQDKGTINPRSEFEVTVHFKAGRIGSIEKTLRLEITRHCILSLYHNHLVPVSDTENILGIFQAENIKISAEVYEVSVSLNMPGDPDGSLEFGTISVLDNVKKVLSLKNKGVYDIEYSFTLKDAGPGMQDIASHFTVQPHSGMLAASQRGVNIEILFHPRSEMVLKNEPIIFCQVIDARLGEGGQVVTSIPVTVSAKAEYSKYSIEPASPIDFGAVIKGTKKSQAVVLENKGALNLKFRIRRAPELAPASESKSLKQGESAPSATKPSSRNSSSLTQLEAKAGHMPCWGAEGTAISHQPLLELFLQGHLNLGMFTVSPCSGSIRPWGQQVIRVECLAGQEGTCEEQLCIDILGRNPKDNPLGIPFTLMAESCLPGTYCPQSHLLMIRFSEDVMLIFEEYPICSSTSLSHMLQSVIGTGLFIRDENQFIFHKALVGQEAEAHFKIYSASPLPCDVVLSIKPLPGKEQIPIRNIFKLDPVKMSVPGSSHAVATVTFTPPDEQNYDCTFKAFFDIPKGSVKMKPQILTFTISGKGHKPQLTVVCPSARSKRGNAVLRFKRLRLGDSETLPLVVRNDGIIPLKFMLRPKDEHGAFFLKGRASTLEVFHTEDMEDDSIENESNPPKKSFFLLHHKQSTKFDVIFKPTLAQRLEGKICLFVKDTYSSKTIAELVGEGHRDEFTLDGLEEDTEEGYTESILKKDIIDAVRVNHLQFGDCPVGKPCHRTFTITNHTRKKVMRFEWEADAPFQFSPKVGHLHPGCAKVITVTLKSDVPGTFRRHLVKCKVTKINFDLPRRKVPDWDDEKCSKYTLKMATSKHPEEEFPKIEKVRSKMAKKANPAFTKRTTITPSLLAEQLLLPLDVGQL
ncbi:hydrocephalus-inducing protein homolog [Lonchura striata]